MLSKIDISTNSFGQKSTNSDTLVIEITPHEIHFCEKKKEGNILLYLCTYPFNRELQFSINEQFLNALHHFQFSKSNYQYVFINYSGNHFTLCPVLFYDSAKARTLLEFNCGAVANDFILTDDIIPEVKLIYSINENLSSTLNNVFPNHQLKHSLTVLSKLMLQAEELIKYNVLVYVKEGSLDIIIKDQQKLLLVNSFTVKTIEDVLYYILFALEQYQLSPSLTHLAFIGNIDSGGALVTTLKKYIKHIYLPVGNKLIHWEQVKGIPQHYYYTLINRIFCE